MIKEYLIKRATILSERIRSNKEKFEHNQIAIVESNNQIKELNDTIDEATQIFSIKAREDNGFKKQEISDLEIRIAAYVSENKDYQEIIDTANKELDIVNQCLEEMENTNVSRETFENSSIVSDDTNTQLQKNIEESSDESLENHSDDEDMKIVVDGFVTNKKTAEIINKLKLCKSIAEIDGKRVSIEIDNIINLIKD